jgi:FkbM family methyltransferase
MLTATAKTALTKCGLSVRTLGAPTQARGVNFWHDAFAILGAPDSVTVFDVGANIGQTIEDCRRHIPHASITAFEPGPEPLAVLRSRYKDDPRVRVEPFAVGEAPGFSTLRLFDDSVLASFLPATDTDERGTLTVQVMDLDTYCEHRRIRRIDILKIDTQGFDLHVLAGASGLLYRHAVRIIRLEVNMRTYYEGQPDLMAILTAAQRFGYRTLAFYDTYFLPDNTVSHMDVALVPA